MFEVWRVEDRTNPDAVDFWDFLSKNEAEKWVNEEMSLDIYHHVVRQLSEKEVIETALANLRNILSNTSHY